jgi:hypothetical protein
LKEEEENKRKEARGRESETDGLSKSSKFRGSCANERINKANLKYREERSRKGRRGKHKDI